MKMEQLLTVFTDDLASLMRSKRDIYEILTIEGILNEHIDSYCLG